MDTNCRKKLHRWIKRFSLSDDIYTDCHITDFCNEILLCFGNYSAILDIYSAYQFIKPYIRLESHYMAFYRASSLFLQSNEVQEKRLLRS